MPLWGTRAFAGWYIRLGIDWGAKYLKLAWQIMPPGRDINDPALAPEMLYLPGYSEGLDGIAQVMVDADGGDGEAAVLVFGNAQVDTYREHHPDSLYRTIASLKRLLHPDFQGREEVKSIREAMECDVTNMHGIQYLLERHLEAIREAAVARLQVIDKGRLVSDSRPDLATLPVEAQIAVPVMWGADARGVMQRAARRAGYVRTNIREESHANASTLVDDMQKLGMKCGDAILLIDAGAATLDLSMMCFTEEGQLSVDSLSGGDSSGSSKLNADAYQVPAQEDVGGPLYGANLGDTCVALGLTKDAVYEQFSRKFDALKPESRDCKSVYLIHIEGRGGHDVRSVRITRESMLRWLNGWIARVEGLVEEWLTQKVPKELRDSCKFAAITGGGSKSLLLCDRLHALLDKYQMQTVEWDPNKHSCCRGLLMTYHFESCRLPDHANFYLAGPMDNIPAGVDPDDTADSTRLRGQVLTCVGSYDRDHEAEFTGRAPVPRVFSIPINADSSGLLHLEFWSDENLQALPANTPLLRQGKLLANLSKLAITFVDISNLHGQGFTRSRIVGHPEGRFCYKVRGTVVLKMRGDSLYAVVTLFKAGHVWCKPCRDRHRGLQSCQHDWVLGDSADVLWTLEEEVWHPDRGALTNSALGGYERHDEVPEPVQATPKRKRPTAVTRTPPARKSARHMTSTGLPTPRDEGSATPDRGSTPHIVTSPAQLSPETSSDEEHSETESLLNELFSVRGDSEHTRSPATTTTIARRSRLPRRRLCGGRAADVESHSSDGDVRKHARRGIHVFPRRPSNTSLASHSRPPPAAAMVDAVDSDEDVKPPRML